MKRAGFSVFGLYGSHAPQSLIILGIVLLIAVLLLGEYLFFGLFQHGMSAGGSLQHN
ncbi:MAG: hypothetical protein ABI443_04845 [Chthoniobacterales bacterium]